MLRTDKGRNFSSGIYKQRAEEQLNIKQNQTELLHNCLHVSRRLSGSPLSLGGAWHPLCLFLSVLPCTPSSLRKRETLCELRLNSTRPLHSSTNTVRGTREMTRLWCAKVTLLGCVMGCTCVVCFVCLCEWARGMPQPSGF